jgi:hypothetical protein
VGVADRPVDDPDTWSKWRWLWLLHPIITFTVVVVTANHYWLDGIVVLLLLGVSLPLRSAPACTTTAADAMVSAAGAQVTWRGSTPAEVPHAPRIRPTSSRPRRTT